jgi:hypothetical protein
MDKTHVDRILEVYRQSTLHIGRFECICNHNVPQGGCFSTFCMNFTLPQIHLNMSTYFDAFHLDSGVYTAYATITFSKAPISCQDANRIIHRRDGKVWNEIVGL